MKVKVDSDYGLVLYLSTSEDSYGNFLEIDDALYQRFVKAKRLFDEAQSEVMEQCKQQNVHY